MLDIFRKASEKWVVKIFLGILGLSFVSWGVGDLRHSAFGTGAAIEVGKISVTAQEVTAEFKREIERLQPFFGGKLTGEEARKIGLLDRTINSIVTRSLIDEAARELGLAANDDMILKAIAADPGLHNAKGQFDRARLQQALAKMGLTEEAFLKLQRADQKRKQMAEALAGSVAVPEALFKPLLERREERRVADVITVKDTNVVPPSPPDATTLEKYYQEHTKAFMAPEFRAVTVLVLNPADVANMVEVTPEMIADGIEQRRDEFTTPERRQVSQIVLGSEADANKAAELVNQGRDLSAVASALKTGVIDLGTPERGDLPPELADKVFALAPGKTLGPVKTDLGWHVVKVISVITQKTKPQAEMARIVEQDIRRDKATDLLMDLSNKVEDALGGGASLEEAGQRFNLKVLKLAAIDEQGKGADRKPIAGLPGDAFLNVAFHTDSGSESQLTDSGNGGFFMLRVDSITPPAPRPFAEVKSAVVDAWTAEQRHASARKLAEAVREAVGSGTPVAQAARAHNLDLRSTEALTRDNSEQAGLPEPVFTSLFREDVGGTSIGPVANGWVVARLVRIEPFDPSKAPEAANNVRLALQRSMSGDVVDQYLSSLNVKFGVKIDRSQLSREE